MIRINVILYAAEWCPGCKKSVEWLSKNKIPFTYIDIEKDNALWEALQAKIHSLGIPVLKVDDSYIIGFRPDEYSKKILGD